MACTFTGSLEGDRQLAADEARKELTRATNILCKMCERLEANKVIHLYGEDLQQWWKEHKKVDQVKEPPASVKCRCLDCNQIWIGSADGKCAMCSGPLKVIDPAKSQVLCLKHPEYKAIRKPTAKCYACQEAYRTAHPKLVRRKKRK